MRIGTALAVSYNRGKALTVARRIKRNTRTRGRLWRNRFKRIWLNEN